MTLSGVPLPADRDVALVDACDRWLETELAGRPIPLLLVVFGLGQGALLDAIARRSDETRVLAFEPDPSAAREFHAKNTWRNWLETGRLTYLADPDYRGADEAWRVFPADPENHQVLVDPAVASHGGDAAVRAAQAFKRIVYGARANADARKRFAPIYLRNTLANIRTLARSGDVGDLFGCATGQHAFLLAAGPSLNRNLAELQRTRAAGLVVVVDTALRPCLGAGIEPDFCVAVDPGTENAGHLSLEAPLTRCRLIAEPSLNPRSFRAFGSRVWTYRVSRHEPWPWLEAQGLGRTQLLAWGCALTTALDFVVRLGCSSVTFLGADFAYTDGQPYCRGTIFEQYWAQEVAGGVPLPAIWKRWKGEEVIAAQGIDGRPTETATRLQAFRDWITAYCAKHPEVRFTNATGAGILDGIERRPLEDRHAQRPVADTGIPAEPAPPAHGDFVRAAIEAFDRTSPSPWLEWNATADSSLDDLVAQFTVSLDAPDARDLRKAYEALRQRIQPHAAPARRPEKPAEPPRELEAALARTRADASVARVAVRERAVSLAGLPEREAALRARLCSGTVPAWTRSAAVRDVADNRQTPWHRALDGLLPAMALTSAPLTQNANFLSEEAVQNGGAALLGYRSVWSPAWRNLLWDFHDNLGLAVVDDVPPPPAAALAALKPALRRFAGERLAATRNCRADDFSLVRLVAESVLGYNILHTPTAIVAAAQRAGAMDLSKLPDATVDRLSGEGVFLCADTYEAIVLRLEQYQRHMVLLAMLHEWATLAAYASRDRHRGQDPLEVFETLSAEVPRPGPASADEIEIAADRLLAALSPAVLE